MAKKTGLSIRGEKLVALPRERVSEPTRSPFVVWSTKHRVIVSEHKTMGGAKSKTSKLNKEFGLSKRK